MKTPKPKKIFYLINSLYKGGAERQLLTISREIGGTIVLLENEIHYAPLPDIEIRVLYENKTSGALSKIKAAIQSVFRFIRMIRREMKENDVVVLSFLERSNIINLLASFFTKHKAIISIRINLNIQYESYPLVQWFFKRFYRYAHAVTSNSAGVCEQLTTEYHVPAQKVFHVPNCYDIEGIQSLASQPMGQIELEELIHARSYLLCVNRLDHQKNISFQIDLIHELKKIFPDICLVIVGDGPQRNSLIQKAKDDGLAVYDNWNKGESASMQASDILFLGHTHNPYRLYSFSKALLLTSQYESLPNVVIEALICKTVVMATDCHFGPREIISADSNYKDPNRMYGKMDCGVLLPLIADTKEALPLWLDFAEKILKEELNYKDFESDAAIKIRQYQIATVSSKWESLFH
jgi:glycosyltransferase involved in cell wall biosynthesis